MKWVLILPLIAFAVSAQAAEVIYSADTYEHLGVVIQAEKIFLKKDKLWFRLRVINETGKVMTIDKEQMQLRLGKSVIAREKGTFGKYSKPQHVSPGVSAQLHVEFVIGELPQSVALVLRRGLIVDGKSIALPDYPAAPLGTR